MFDLQGDWRKLVGQQAISTGGVQPSAQQAQALAYNDLMPGIKAMGVAANQGLTQQQLDNTKAINEQKIALDTSKLAQEASSEQSWYGLGQKKQEAANQAFTSQMGYKTNMLDLAKSMETYQAGLSEAKFGLQQQQTADKRDAGMIAGAIGLPVAGITGYSLYQNIFGNSNNSQDVYNVSSLVGKNAMPWMQNTPTGNFMGGLFSQSGR